MPRIIPIRDLKDTSAISQMCSESSDPIYCSIRIVITVYTKGRICYTPRKRNWREQKCRDTLLP